MPKVMELPGVEGEGVSKPKIKEIDAAAAEYVRIRDKRMEWTKKEVAAQAALVQLMKDHELKTYEYDEEVVRLIPGKDKVKVSVNTGEKDEGED